ncbi:MAG: ABC transporter substrate-binding protein [Spirochaetes bacterium]|nr:ABC transporter substrate-binding protein [Spirochaetota bacterium]
MKKRILTFAAICLSAVFLFTACGPSADVAPGQEPVRFLMSAMMSGPNAESGRQVAMAAQAAEWYINTVLGGFPSLGGRPVELVIVDSTSDASLAASPFELALGTGTFSVVIGNPNSSISLVNQPIAEAFQIPQIVSAAANIALSQGGFQFTFQPSATAPAFIPLQMDFIEYYAGLLGIPVSELRLGLIYADDAWGTDNANNTRLQVQARGLNLVFDQSYNVPTFTDATPLVTALMAADVNVLLPSSYPSDLSLIFTAKGALGFSPLVIGGGAAMTWPSLYVDLGAAVNGITSIDAFVNDQTGARNHPSWMRMNDWYESTFGEFIPGQAGPTLYSIMLAYAAIENIGSDDPVLIRDELRRMNASNTDWFSVINGDGFFDATGMNAGARPVILQWQNSRPTAVFPPDLAASPLLNPQTMQPFN